MSARKHVEQRENLQREIRAASGGAAVEQAIPNVIRALCTAQGWAYGARWVLDRKSGVLSCADSWSVALPEVERFAKESSSRFHNPSAGGLVRRVWSTGAPVWIADIAREPSVQRGLLAMRSGLQSALRSPSWSAGNSRAGVFLAGAAPARR
jgi:hypothetical protein